MKKDTLTVLFKEEDHAVIAYNDNEVALCVEVVRLDTQMRQLASGAIEPYRVVPSRRYQSRIALVDENNMPLSVTDEQVKSQFDTAVSKCRQEMARLTKNRTLFSGLINNYKTEELSLEMQSATIECPHCLKSFMRKEFPSGVSKE